MNYTNLYIVLATAEFDIAAEAVVSSLHVNAVEAVVIVAFMSSIAVLIDDVVSGNAFPTVTFRLLHQEESPTVTVHAATKVTRNASIVPSNSDLIHICDLDNTKREKPWH